jgi:hypothetical protein
MEKPMKKSEKSIAENNALNKLTEKPIHRRID